MKTNRKDVQHREITDKELNSIIRAFGENVRAKSVEVDRKVQENLQREFTAMRGRAEQMLKDKESC